MKMDNSELEVLTRLESNQELTAEAVLEAAKSPTSPLHKRFTWDDSEAARMYRLNEARGIIRSFILTVVPAPRGEKVVAITTGNSQPRAFVSSANGNGNFVSRDTMLRSSALRLRHIEAVLNQISGYLSTNSDIEELVPIREVVDQVRMDVRRKAG